MKIDPKTFDKFSDAKDILKFTKSDTNGNLAGNMAVRAMEIFEYLMERLEENERVDFICCVGGRDFQVKKLGFLGDTIFIETYEENGSSVCIYTLIDQVSFMYAISPITEDRPQREVGFHTLISDKV